MLAGFHVSIAGGIDKSADRAARLGINTMQVFTHSPRSWHWSVITDELAEEFKRKRFEAGIAPVFAHTSYLINLASSDPGLYRKSIEALKEELRRADMLGIEYVVTHLGSASGSKREEAERRTAEAIMMTFDGLDVKPRLLLENTSGSRGDVGYCFGGIARIIDMSGVEGLGVVFDTCHALGSGYDIVTPVGLEATVGGMESTFGLDRLKLVHLNDSKKPLASHRDRHEHIGKGYIGRAAFGRIINHPRLRDVPFVMETPMDEPGDDVRNLRLVRRLRKGE